MTLVIALHHRRRGRRPRAATSVDPVVGIGILGLAAAAFAGVGLAVGGLVRSSLAAGVTGVLIVATLLLDTLGAALKLPQWVLDLSLYKHLGQPMAGIYDPVGIVVATVMAVGGLADLHVGPHAARHRQVTSEGATLGHRRSSPSRPSCISPGTSGSRPPATRSGRRRSGCSRRRSGSCRSASPSGCRRVGRPCRPRASRSGLASGVVEAAYFIFLSAAYRRGDLSVVYPLARGTAPLLAVFIGVVVLGRAARRRRLDRGHRAAGRVPVAAAAVAGDRPGAVGRRPARARRPPTARSCSRSRPA